MVKDEAKILEKIKQAEETIEAAMWAHRDNEDYKAEVRAYQEVGTRLESFEGLPLEIQRERDRVLSYCIMRLDEALSNSGDNSDTIKRVMHALDLAEKSENAVQIARCHLALGVRLLNQGKIPEAEENWRQVFRLSEGREDEDDMQQVLGWTLLARAHVVNAKSLYSQAYGLLLRARGILHAINNFAGLAAVHKLLAQVCYSLGYSEEAEMSHKLAAEYDGRASKERR
ncbi:MAG: hypothetical protein EAX95_02360 [Candidatus Thorarchaeota archaeon]|nr:hypothetical protein [Candidatus Thorarchaeota archaeon]